MAVGRLVTMCTTSESASNGAMMNSTGTVPSTQLETDVAVSKVLAYPKWVTSLVVCVFKIWHQFLCNLALMTGATLSLSPSLLQPLTYQVHSAATTKIIILTGATAVVIN